jgi:hypothetical protein
MGLESLISRHVSQAVTAETAGEMLTLQPEPLTSVDCTSETAETWRLDNIGKPSAGEITCADCRHAIPVALHSALVGCVCGVESGNPTRHRWKTDRHHCAAFAGRQG